MTKHPYSDLADALWTEYLTVLRTKGHLSHEACALAGVLHTIGRDGWVMGGQSYTYGSNQNDLRTVRNRAKSYPDKKLSAWMVKALDDVESGYYHKHYGGRRWKWPDDFARPQMHEKNGIITVAAITETKLAEVNLAAMYTHVEIKIYDEKPDWTVPKSERIQPISHHKSAKNRFILDVLRGALPPGYYFISGGLVGPGAAGWDDLEIEWKDDAVEDTTKTASGTEVHDPVDAGVADHDGPDMSALIAHCERWKATQPTSNIGHHARWVAVRKMIEDKHYPEAKVYAQKWADKGWRPWADLIGMLP